MFASAGYPVKRSATGARAQPRGHDSVGVTAAFAELASTRDPPLDLLALRAWLN